MDGAFPSQRGFRGTAENAKTKLCTRWMEGDCRFGDRCNFAHGEAELRKPGPTNGDRGGYMGRGRGGPHPGGPFGGRGAPGGGRGYGGRGYGGPEDHYGAPGYGGYGGPPQGYGGAGYGGGVGMDHHGGYGAPPGMPEEVWVAQGCPTAGPNGWYMYRTKDTGEAYFHNHRTNQTTWERPADWPAGAPM